MNGQEERLIGGGEDVRDDEAEGPSAAGDGGQAAVSLMPDIDGTHVHIFTKFATGKFIWRGWGLTVLASLGGVVGPTSSAKGTALSMIPAGCRAAKQPCLCHVTSFPTRPQLVESGRNTGLTRKASWLPAGL